MQLSYNPLFVSFLFLATASGTLFGTLLVLLAVGLFVTRLGFRDATRPSILLCYSSVWLLVTTITALLTALGTLLAEWLLPSTCAVNIPGLPWPMDCATILAGVLAIAPLSSVLLWWVQLAHMLRDTRFANA